jgi:hypothetical protein
MQYYNHFLALLHIEIRGAIVKYGDWPHMVDAKALLVWRLDGISLLSTSLGSPTQVLEIGFIPMFLL